MAETKQYLIAGIIVEATPSPGGGFYEVTIFSTQAKYRFVAEVFESVAKPYEEKKR